MAETCLPPRLLVSIVDRGKANIIAELCSKNQVELNFACLGSGTASSELLSLLGLGSKDKSVVLSIMPESLVQSTMTAISRRMSIRNPGRGIAFTVPIIGLNALAAFYLSKLQTQENHRKAEEIVKFMLIIAVFNSGYSDNIMEAAAAAGATGGTILHANSLGGETAENFLGVELRREKEILAILAPEDTYKPIMEGITKCCGPKSEAGAIAFSLPVKDLIGL